MLRRSRRHSRTENGAEMTPSRNSSADRHMVTLPLAAAMLAASVVGNPCAADAQSQGDRSPLQILVTPYFWAPEVSVKVKSPRPRVPDVDETVGFDDLFNHLS